MERPICVLCGHWISEWQEQTGKIILVRGVPCHISCCDTVKSAQVQIDGKKTA